MTTAGPPVAWDHRLRAGEPAAVQRVHAGDPVVFGGVAAGASVVLHDVVAGEPVSWGAVQVAPAVQTMVTAEGLRVWVGEHRPSVVVGAAVGDLYIDAITGLLYRLN